MNSSGDSSDEEDSVKKNNSRRRGGGRTRPSSPGHPRRRPGQDDDADYSEAGDDESDDVDEGENEGAEFEGSGPTLSLGSALLPSPARRPGPPTRSQARARAQAPQFASFSGSMSSGGISSTQDTILSDAETEAAEAGEAALSRTKRSSLRGGPAPRRLPPRRASTLARGNLKGGILI